MARGRKAIDDELDFDGAENVNLTISLPKGTSSKVMKQAIDKIGDMTMKEMDADGSANEGRLQYMREGGRRWVCKVDALMKGMTTFEMAVPVPSNPDIPVIVRGRCGVVLKDGLTKFVIDRLNEAYYVETEEDTSPRGSRNIGVDHKAVKRPLFRVNVMDEIPNPKPVGKIGTLSKAD